MPTLITGATGFVGQHALRMLPAAFALEADGPVEIREPDSIRRAIKGKNFDQVLHLAAQSQVPRSLEDPNETYAVNFTGTWNLFQCLAESGFRGRLVAVSSAEVYGHVEDDRMPISEDEPVRPRNPYAVSKVAMEALCGHWNRAGAFEIIVARPFNQFGPGQSPQFFVSHVARQIAEIAAGKREPVIATGSLEITRDFTDICDGVNAFGQLFKKGVKGEVYNVCSGREIRLKDIVLELKKITQVEFEIKTDATRLRSTDQKRMLGTNRKLQTATGWAPTIPWQKTLRDVYQYWVEELQ